MSRVTCSISGLKFTASYFDSLTLSHTEGYIHPIFAIERLDLYPYYQDHCLGKLTAVDSYLLFLAFLHSSEKLTWNYPASCNPQNSATRQLIEANFSQLVAVLEKTDLISHPSFEQPSFKVYFDNSSLRQIPNWIAAWEDNCSDFYTKKASQSDLEDLQRLENKLTTKIYSGDAPEKYARVIANWAAVAADFSPSVSVLWKETIRSCFSMTKMFNTPLPLLKEIKECIECNIPVGSIHFSAVYAVIKEGIAKHEDYLGGSSLALGYTLLPTLDSTGKPIALSTAELKGSAEVATIAAAASATLPKRMDYPDTLSFIKAKLAYRVAANISQQATAARASEILVSSKLAGKAEQNKPAEPTPVEEQDSHESQELDYSLEESDLDGLTITDNLDGELT